MQGVKALSAAADALRPRRRGITILIYHRVGGGSGRVDLPTGLFADQMDFVADQGVLALDGALEQLQGDPVPGGDPVAVTFDDGTADFVDAALPVLVERRVPVTLYVATSFVEEGRKFPSGALPLSWAALAEAVASGYVTVGSHTHSHALLDRLDGRLVEDELDRSLGLIEDRLGVTARHFAYPKAVLPSANAEECVRARFVSAAVGGMRPNPYGSTDPHRLARSPIQVDDGIRWFRRKAAGGMALEDSLRTALNRRRYAGATS
jgi:peptidoglycan/xylan/chitin deacetylase (PgdA/CDA1 family)